MTYKEVLTILREQEQSLGISRYRIAKITGYDRATIKRIMEGTTIAPVDKLLAICDALNVKVKIYV